MIREFSLLRNNIIIRIIPRIYYNLSYRMANTELIEKSFFDLVEEREAAPVHFGWATDIELLKFSPEEYLHQGSLLAMAKNANSSEVHRYVLTLTSLCLCKEDSPVDPQCGAVRIKAILRLRNPRVRKTESTRLYSPPQK